MLSCRVLPLFLATVRSGIGKNIFISVVSPSLYRLDKVIKIHFGIRRPARKRPVVAVDIRSRPAAASMQRAAMQGAQSNIAGLQDFWASIRNFQKIK